MPGRATPHRHFRIIGQHCAYSAVLRTGGCLGIMEHDPPIIAKTAIGSGIALSTAERERHVYIVGKSGSGKSTVLFNLAMHDIYAGEGVAVLDPTATWPTP